MDAEEIALEIAVLYLQKHKTSDSQLYETMKVITKKIVNISSNVVKDPSICQNNVIF